MNNEDKIKEKKEKMHFFAINISFRETFEKSRFDCVKINYFFISYFSLNFLLSNGKLLWIVIVLCISRIDSFITMIFCCRCDGLE